MRLRFILFAGVQMLAATLAAGVEEKFPVLKVGDEVYSNATVTSVTATDIYFRYAQGMGNAKLKNLDPKLQQHFHFNATNASELELKQRVDTAQFRQAFSNRLATVRVKPAPEEEVGATKDNDGDTVMTKLFAKSFRGQQPPQIFVDQWLTSAPDVTGKFIWVVFWKSWAEPCLKSIPHLNESQAKFQSRLVVIGLSDESAEDMRKMGGPRVDFYVGLDSAARTMKALEVIGVPHSILMDPQGIVRFEGIPDYLEEDGLQHLINKYGP